MRLPLCVKVRVVNQYVPPVMIYGSGTWTQEKVNGKKIEKCCKMDGEVDVGNYFEV